ARARGVGVAPSTWATGANVSAANGPPAAEIMSSTTVRNPPKECMGMVIIGTFAAGGGLRVVDTRHGRGVLNKRCGAACHHSGRTPVLAYLGVRARLSVQTQDEPPVFRGLVRPIRSSPLTRHS